MQIDRRNFLKQSALIGATSLLPSFAHSMAPGFRLLILATNWGFPGTIDEFCKRAKDAGYDGIEVWWKDDDALFAALDKYKLEVGFLCSGNSNEYTKHAASFEAALTAATTQRRKRPLYINCHSGKDYFSFDQNSKLIDITTRISQQTNIPIYHETHRSRMLFAAHVARQFIEAKPALRLTLDLSHWCNVHESFLQDQPEAVSMALARASHIHARIGHPQGAQVNDPRAPEWEQAVKAHFAWWDEVVKLKQAKGETLTVLTEFGPVDYMPALPYTRQPLANQWDINVHMMKLFKSRYSKG
jgi:sugar phosphate isomerase/epimerase